MNKSIATVAALLIQSDAEEADFLQSVFSGGLIIIGLIIFFLGFVAVVLFLTIRMHIRR
jgi:hypothetical protein